MRQRLMIIGVAVVVLAVVAAAVTIGIRLVADANRTELQRAMALAPDEGQRFSWTDWSGVRDELGLDLDAASSTEEVAALLDAGFEDDLTSTSALVDSAPELQASYAFSPASIDWELFVQSEVGATVIMGLPDDADLDAIADALRALGYVEPDDPEGIWVGSTDVIGVVGEVGAVTPELLFVSLHADDGLIYSSDTSVGVEYAVEDADDGRDAAGGLEDVVAAAGEPLSAALYTGDQVCGALAMSSADPTEQQDAATLLEAAGDVNPMTGFVMAALPGGDVRVVMGFENDEQARTNADTRSTLASGPAPGQGGDFGDRFTLGPVTAEGSLVTMELEPVDGAYVVSDLSTGPVLFATC